MTVLLFVSFRFFIRQCILKYAPSNDTFSNAQLCCLYVKMKYYNV